MLVAPGHWGMSLTSTQSKRQGRSTATAGHYGLITALVRREVVGRYRGSALGIAWSLLTPLFMLAVYTWVFGTVFQARWAPAAGGASASTPSTGEFAIILFVGLIVFQLFAEVVNGAPGLILANANYVKKVIFPLEILPVVALGAALFHAAVSLVVLAGFMLAVHVPAASAAISAAGQRRRGLGHWKRSVLASLQKLLQRSNGPLVGDATAARCCRRKLPPPTSRAKLRRDRTRSASISPGADMGVVALATAGIAYTMMWLGLGLVVAVALGGNLPVAPAKAAAGALLSVGFIKLVAVHLEPRRLTQTKQPPANPGRFPSTVCWRPKRESVCRSKTKV